MEFRTITWKRIACLVEIIVLFGSIGGCSWTPQVETELHNSPKGIVLLRTIADSSIQADHPVSINERTMTRLLGGAHKYRDPRLIEGLITDDEKPKRLFSQKQIMFLAPLLTSALENATSEEEVFFQCTSEFEGAPPIKGNMLVHDSTLFFTWNEPLSKPKVLAKQHRQPGMLMDPSMPQGHMITFIPNDAIRVEGNSTKDYLVKLGENTLAIDYQVLADLPQSVFEIPELQDEDGAPTVEDVRRQEEQPAPRVQTKEEPPKAVTSGESDASADIRALREQMEKLQKEVDKQQEELDRIKKNKP